MCDMFSKRRANLAEQDRLHGAGLPAGLADDAYHRIAHRIWELRPVEGDGDEGYALVRLHEEPAADLRRTARKGQLAHERARTPAQEAAEVDELIDSQSDDPHAVQQLEIIHDRLLDKAKLGARVLAVRRGQLAPAIVINVNQAEGTADVEHADGAVDTDVPVEMLLVVDEPEGSTAHAVPQPTVDTAVSDPFEAQFVV